jgi:hypothetical protein
MIVKIGGVEVDYEFGSIEVENAIGERSTASFTIIDKDGTSKFYKGQPVEIYSVGGPLSTLATWENDDLSVSWESDL